MDTGETYDAYDEFAGGWQDIPADTFPLRPAVWAHVKCSEVKKTSNTYKTPNVPQLQAKFDIVESGHNPTPDKTYGAPKVRPTEVAKGAISAFLAKPPKGHPGYTEGGWNRECKLFRKAMAAAAGLTTKDQDELGAQIDRAARDAGGFDKLLEGKDLLIRIGINDGTDYKTGDVVSQARYDDPRNQVDNYIPYTEANVAAYVRGQK